MRGNRGGGRCTRRTRMQLQIYIRTQIYTRARRSRSTSTIPPGADRTRTTTSTILHPLGTSHPRLRGRNETRNRRMRPGRRRAQRPALAPRYRLRTATMTSAPASTSW
jgi:hypothetical protein